MHPRGSIESGVGRQMRETDQSARAPLSPRGRAYRERLIRFYEHYDPKKLIVVDDMLKDAYGNEESLFEALQRLHGPEPPPRTGPGSATFHARLTRFYERYNPAKLPDVPKVVAEYTGREEQLFMALTHKYGPEPSLPTSPSGPANDTVVAQLMDENKRLRRNKQVTVLAALASAARGTLLRTYYYRWLEHLWWNKNKEVLAKVVEEGRAGLLKERFVNQQLTDQVALLREQLAVAASNPDPLPPPPRVHTTTSMDPLEMVDAVAGPDAAVRASVAIQASEPHGVPSVRGSRPASVLQRRASRYSTNPPVHDFPSSPLNPADPTPRGTLQISSPVVSVLPHPRSSQTSAPTAASTQPRTSGHYSLRPESMAQPPTPPPHGHPETDRDTLIKSLLETHPVVANNPALRSLLVPEAAPPPPTSPPPQPSPPSEPLVAHPHHHNHHHHQQQQQQHLHKHDFHPQHFPHHDRHQHEQLQHRQPHPQQLPHQHQLRHQQLQHQPHQHQHHQQPFPAHAHPGHLHQQPPQEDDLLQEVHHHYYYESPSPNASPARRTRRRKEKKRQREKTRKDPVDAIIKEIDALYPTIFPAGTRPHLPPDSLMDTLLGELTRHTRRARGPEGTAATLRQLSPVRKQPVDKQRTGTPPELLARSVLERLRQPPSTPPAVPKPPPSTPLDNAPTPPTVIAKLGPL